MMKIDYGSLRKNLIPAVILLTAMCILIICLALISVNKDAKSDRVQLMQRMEAAHMKFRTMHPLEFHSKFLEIVNKHGDKDNITSLVFQDLGGIFNAADKDIGRELNTWIEARLCHRRYNYAEILPGDFIMFKPIWVGNKQYQKACVIEEFKNGYIKYIDHDVEKGLLFGVVSMNDFTIDKVIIHELSIWLGDSFANDYTNPNRNRTHNTLYNGTFIVRGFEATHIGIDLLLTNYDREVYAFQDGVVVSAYSNYDHKYKWARVNTGGNYCIIKSVINGQVYYFQYMHLVYLQVKHGMKVNKGQLLGQYADVGYSFGAHLHLGMFKNYDALRGPTDPFDPLPWVYANASFVIFNRVESYKTIARL